MDNYDLFGVAQNIKKQIFRRAHLGVGVGIAPTKTLAKLANNAAKKWQATGGVVDLRNKERQRKLLSITPVSEIWGIGKQYDKKLSLMGISNALQLAEYSPVTAKKQFSVNLERTIRELNGEACFSFDDIPASRKQIIHSRSFGEKTSDYNSIHQALCHYAESAALRLRQSFLYCKRITVFGNNSPFNNTQAFYNAQSSYELHYPTQDTRMIIDGAIIALRKIYKENISWHKIGIMLCEITNSERCQLDLFSEQQLDNKSKKLMRVIDEINNHKPNQIWFAGQGTQSENENKRWALKREKLSPFFTTVFRDVKTCS